MGTTKSSKKAKKGTRGFDGVTGVALIWGRRIVTDVTRTAALALREALVQQVPGAECVAIPGGDFSDPDDEGEGTVHWALGLLVAEAKANDAGPSEPIAPARLRELRAVADRVLDGPAWTALARYLDDAEGFTWDDDQSSTSGNELLVVPYGPISTGALWLGRIVSGRSTPGEGVSRGQDQHQEPHDEAVAGKLIVSCDFDVAPVAFEELEQAISAAPQDELRLVSCYD